VHRGGPRAVVRAADAAAVHGGQVVSVARLNLHDMRARGRRGGQR
jgi:hypothetical protein